MLKAEFSRCFSCVYIYFIISSTNIAPYVFVLIVFIRRSHLFYTGFLINVDFTFTNALNIMFVRSCLPQMRYGPCFNIKMSSCQYRNFHCEVKTVVRLSFHHNNISLTGKMASLYWINSLVHAMWDKMGAIWRKRFHSNIILDQMALQWRHNQCDCVSNHWRLDCLFNSLSKLHVTGLCVGNSPVTGEFPTQRASNAKNISIWWHHHRSSSVDCTIRR